MSDSERDGDVSRRDLVALIGMLGGAAGFAALSGCSEAGASGEGIGQVRQAWTTTDSDVADRKFLWVDTIKGVGTVHRGTTLYTLTAGDDARGGSGASASSPVVVAGGYLTPGDGGGGVFYWSRAAITDDGGTQIVPLASGGDGGVGAQGPGWVRIHSGQLSVKAFGAVGDGSTDDSAAIQAGFNATSASGSELFFPSGTYLINTAPTIPPGSQARVSVNVAFTGPGASMPGHAVKWVFQSNPDFVILTDTFQPNLSNTHGYTTGAPAPFSIGYESAHFNSTYDHVQHVGYNVLGSVANEPQIRWSVEANYEGTPGSYSCEMHCQLYEPGTTAGFIRPFSVSYQRGNSTAPLYNKGQLGIAQSWNDAGTPGQGYLSWNEFSTQAQIITWTTNQAFIVPVSYPFNYTRQTSFLCGSAVGTAEAQGFSVSADNTKHNFFQLDGFNQFFQLSLSNTRQAYFIGGSLYLGAILSGDGAPLLLAASGGISLSHAGTTKLSGSQASNPIIQLADTGLTGDATVVFPTTPQPTSWTVDTTNNNFAGHTITLQMGTAEKTITLSVQGVITLYSDGVGKLFSQAYS